MHIMKFSDIELPSNKKFGTVIGLFLALVSLYFFYINNIHFGIFFIFISIILLVITSIKPVLLTNLNKVWMLIGFILSKIVNPLVLGIIFFIIITPIGIFLRVIGRDELKIKNASSSSFWESKENAKVEPESYKNQF